MSQQAMAQVIDTHTNDPSFREELRNDPQGAIEQGGFDLTEQERQAIAGVDWSMSHEQLKERVSKFFF